jgi:hypothetical protein
MVTLATINLPHFDMLIFRQVLKICFLGRKRASGGIPMPLVQNS